MPSLHPQDTECVIVARRIPVGVRSAAPHELNPCVPTLRMDLGSAAGHTPGHTSGAAVIETRIRRVGNSAVMTPTTEMPAMLDVEEDDTLFVLRGDDGSLKVTAHDPSVAAALEAAEVVMDHNRDLLAALA